jgi:hypothetical protein
MPVHSYLHTPLRFSPIELLSMGGLFSLFYFWGLAWLDRAYPSLLNPVILIDQFLHAFIPLLLACTIVIALKYGNFFKNLHPITFSLVLIFSVLFSPLWPLLAHISYPDDHFCRPDNCLTPVEDTPLTYYTHKTFATFWHNAGNTDPAFFVFLPYGWITTIATFIWLTGAFKYIKLAQNRNSKIPI